jgi:hypothetical protein
MPLVPFSDLPDDARIWAFGADAPIDDIDAPRLLAAVDGFLYAWTAHGHPLTCAREWRDEYFLVIGVDQRTEGASGCSIDGLFRTLQAIEQGIGASLVGGGRVFFRDSLGLLHSVPRADFEALAASGHVGPTTPVYDTTLTTMADYRARFATTAGAAWHAALLGG